MNQKALFKQILATLVIILAVLPVIVTFSAVLTSFFEKIKLYVWLQDLAVPFESRLVAVLIQLFGIKGIITPGSSFAMVLRTSSGTFTPVALEWNCLGWQSLILLGLTLITGLRGAYTGLSKAQVVLFGILGTFLSNLFRMAFIVILAFYWNSFAAMIIHDYFASFVAIIWMLFFWWFSYRYILEEKPAGN